MIYDKMKYGKKRFFKKNTMISFNLDGINYKIYGSILIFNKKNELIICSEDRWYNKKGEVRRFFPIDFFIRCSFQDKY